MFAILAAILLAHTVGQRSPNGEITGDAQASGSQSTATTTPTADLAAAKAAAAAQPKSYDAQIAYARALLTAGDTTDASQQYLAAAQVGPTQAEPLAYAGYLSTLAVAEPAPTRPTKQTLHDCRGRESRTGDRA